MQKIIFIIIMVVFLGISLSYIFAIIGSIINYIHRQISSNNKEEKTNHIIENTHGLKTAIKILAQIFNIQGLEDNYNIFNRLQEEKNINLSGKLNDISSIEKSYVLQNIGIIFPNAEEIDISNNNIENIYDNIGTFTALKKIKASNNDIENIPGAIGKLSELKEMDFSNNLLTTLPYEIENLHNIKEIKLNNNQIVYLPKEIGKLHNLEELNLGNNKLKEMPKEIRDLKYLKRLYISNNEFLEMPIMPYEIDYKVVNEIMSYWDFSDGIAYLRDLRDLNNNPIEDEKLKYYDTVINRIEEYEKEIEDEDYDEEEY